ncbi:MAG: VPS10 domain-containing protein [Planctomycetota bacterium]|jgi:photosystem II stability/assembly factor-like uncharacterized protein
MSRALLMGIALCIVGTLADRGSAQPTGDEVAGDAHSAIDSGLLGALTFRSIGPALMSGRIADLAIDPVKPNTWYVAVGSGGLWKTVNAGTTWTPIFDTYGSYSIGCVTLDPSNRNTVWVGTGENVGGRHVGYGDGVYVSHDGGKSFRNVGLAKSEHLSKIIVDPRDSNVVYVASQGPLWSSGGERGLYKSTDGGASWELILAKGEWTGVTDIVMDHDDPDVLYAATHQRHRTVAALLNAGPESGIHKSTDGGATWTELKTGLPGADKGKIALAVSPQKSHVVYATIELAGRGGGFYRSTDGGASWTKMSDYLSGGTGPHYYQEIYADPHRFDVLYHANVRLGRTEDGGATFTSVGNRAKHVDNHAVAFHPTDSDFVLVGCDGGLYKSYDYGATYDFTENLPLTQFYKVDVDYDWPVYHVVGGTQDNNTQYGPAKTLTRNGIRNADWRITIGGDGHDCAIDPEDPNIIYCESQQGYLARFDRKTGEAVSIRPQPEQGEDDLRFNWDSPIHISPHSHTRLYFGSKKLHRSDDRGDSWTAISGDLSRNQDRLLMKMMGRIWSVDAAWDLMAMSQYGNITSVSESPVVEGLIYVGTDDGMIQVTEDGGANWRAIDRIFGVPEYFFVNDIKADMFDADTVYACVDNHKTGDFAPYILKSTDRGETWSSISGDLPDRHLVWRIIQDGERADLLFAGTEYGAFVTLNGGQNWLKMAGIPTIPVRDLEIQRRENDLVAATFGRSFYVLDDYTPLRELNDELLADAPFHMFAIKDALLYFPDDKLGGPRGSQGNSYYVADNPPFGAHFTYYLDESLQTTKQQRTKREKANAKSGADNPYPGWEAIKAEDREDGPMVLLEIRDAAGNIVDRISGASSKGIHRTNWNLRYAPFTAGGGGGRFFGGGSGPMIAPGTYTVTAYKRIGDETTQLGDATSFEVQSIIEPTLPLQDRRDVLAFQFEAGELQRSTTAMAAKIAQAMEEVAAMKQVITDGRTTDLALLDQARAVELKLMDAREMLSGDRTATSRYATGTPSITSRLQNALFGTMRQSYGPTTTHRRQLEIARAEYAEIAGEIKNVLDNDVPALKEQLDAAGAPWTPGRAIPAVR